MVELVQFLGGMEIPYKYMKRLAESYYFSCKVFTQQVSSGVVSQAIRTIQKWYRRRQAPTWMSC